MFDVCVCNVVCIGAHVGKAMAEGNKWYFYSRRTQNRITENGYWKALGGDEAIMSSSGSRRVGMKRYYMFYFGESPEGVKTNWIMEEFRLSDAASTSTRSSKRRGSHSKIVRTFYIYIHTHILVYKVILRKEMSVTSIKVI